MLPNNIIFWRELLRHRGPAESVFCVANEVCQRQPIAGSLWAIFDSLGLWPFLQILPIIWL
jgi:hypothetical protein